MRLKDHVIAMEYRDSRSRGDYVANTLRMFGMSPVFQTWALPRIRNIIVDLPPATTPRRVLFTSHYDAVKGTPAANDNASGVAVLLGLCQAVPCPPIPLRIVFFDREEAWLRTPLLKLGLLGSLYHAMRCKTREVAAVYNLEFVGDGDLAGIWPVKGTQTTLPAVHTIEQAAARLKVPARPAHVPWMLLSSDHLPFRLRGIKNAVTLSLLPSGQAMALDSFLSHVAVHALLLHRRPPLPAPLSRVHTPADTAANTNEDSLRLALSLLIETIHEHAMQAPPTDPAKPG